MSVPIFIQKLRNIVFADIFGPNRRLSTESISEGLDTISSLLEMKISLRQCAQLFSLQDLLKELLPLALELKEKELLHDAVISILRSKWDERRPYQDAGDWDRVFDLTIIIMNYEDLEKKLVDQQTAIADKIRPLRLRLDALEDLPDFLVV